MMVQDYVIMGLYFLGMLAFRGVYNATRSSEVVTPLTGTLMHLIWPALMIVVLVQHIVNMIFGRGED